MGPVSFSMCFCSRCLHFPFDHFKGLPVPVNTKHEICLGFSFPVGPSAKCSILCNTQSTPLFSLRSPPPVLFPSLLPLMPFCAIVVAIWPAKGKDHCGPCVSLFPFLAFVHFWGPLSFSFCFVLACSNPHFVWYRIKYRCKHNKRAFFPLFLVSSLTKPDRLSLEIGSN